MSRSRVLLTGKSGFTGRYVTRELEQAGYEVVGLSDTAGDQDKRSPAVDLLDREAVAKAVVRVKPDIVIHLAAISFVAHGDADQIYRVNIVGTRNLLDALVQQGIGPRMVILASSANIYGNSDVEPITEDVPAAPANDYAVSKFAMERMASLWSDRLPLVITRPFNYTGVGQSANFLIPKIVDHFRRGEKLIELGNTHVARDFGDVRDVAKAYKAMLDVDPIGRTLNICTGTGTSLGDILDRMGRIAGYQIEVRVNPAFVRANEVERLVGSHASLTELTGWSPGHDMGQTLRWMYEDASRNG